MEDDYVDHLMAEGSKRDIWGDRTPVPLIRRFQKSTLAPFYEAATVIAATARITDAIEINTKGVALTLTNDEGRLLRRFARLQTGICVDVQLLNEGLSGARVLRTDVKDAQGGMRIAAVSKIGRHEMISSEVARYEREVVRLPPGTYAPRIPSEVARVIGSEGAFYRLLDGYGFTLFEVLNSSDTIAAGCVEAIRANEGPWANSKVVEKVRVSDLVKLLIWEDRLTTIRGLLDGIDWAPFEEREIFVNMCTRHGDLHGENALVNGQHQVMLIDYGAVDRLPSAIDAVTLELSPFFHPHGHRTMIHWNPGEGGIDWFDRLAFGALTSIPNYIDATSRLGPCRRIRRP